MAGADVGERGVGGGWQEEIDRKWQCSSLIPPQTWLLTEGKVLANHRGVPERSR